VITILAGGSGSSKLIRGMTEATDDKLNIISNIGDNSWNVISIFWKIVFVYS